MEEITWFSGGVERGGESVVANRVLEGGNKNTEELRRGGDQLNFIVTRPETFFNLNHSYHICTQAIYGKFRRKRHFYINFGAPQYLSQA